VYYSIIESSSATPKNLDVKLRFAQRMTVQLTSREISRKYDRFARWYDLVEGIPDLVWIRKLRRRLLAHAGGSVIEVAVGTGKNLPYLPRSCRIIGVDVSPAMLQRARQRAADLGIPASFVVADAAALPFAEHAADTVVSSLTTCTFPDPDAALREMRRVCQPAGRILLIEHGRSNCDWLARWQDRRADAHARQLGCHWNREPLELLDRSGLHVSMARRSFFGVFYQIEARP
jgi:ubiquinone/menaquinone biosynthesis C-methylase UbiE